MSPPAKSIITAGWAQIITPLGTLSGAIGMIEDVYESVHGYDEHDAFGPIVQPRQQD